MSDLIQTEYGLMAKHLSSDKLGNLCTDENGIITGPFGSQLHKSDYVDIGTPILTVEHLVDNRISRNNLPCVCDTDRDRLSRYQAVTGDVIVSRVGSVDRRALIRESECGWLFSGRCLRIRVNRSLLSPEYLSWFLGFDGYKQYIRKIAVGATMPSLNTDILRNLDVYFPPLHEQKAIAHILGSLDDKIDQLRKTNTVLEDMATALFKSWFVDFDPVKAKQENRPTGLPKDLDDLFPDSFEDSALGPIPKGWRVGNLSEYSKLNPESWTKQSRPDRISYVDLSNTKWGRIDYVTEFVAKDAPSRAQRILRPLDTIVGTVRPGNGSFALISDNGLTGSTGFAVLRPLRREYAEFVYLAATSSENIERLSNLADGGAYPAVRPEVVSITAVPIATHRVLDEFSNLVGSMMRRIADNVRISNTLTNLRDTLLPKLISGELRVPDAEQMVAELGL